MYAIVQYSFILAVYVYNGLLFLYISCLCMQWFNIPLLAVYVYNDLLFLYINCLCIQWFNIPLY